MSEHFDLDLTPDLDTKVTKVPELAQDALTLAEQIAQVARETAPVGETGAYRDGISAMSTGTGARVIATDYTSGWIEFGAPRANIHGRYNIRNAAASLGLKFRKGGSGA